MDLLTLSGDYRGSVKDCAKGEDMLKMLQRLQ